MINYISNTMWEDPFNDAVHLGDTMWVNDYIWTQHGDLYMKEEFDRLCKTDKNKLIVISEFGLCEPTFYGGDAKRIQMFHDKMDWYERYPQIGGIIHFCLNDYRTQMGEEESEKIIRGSMVSRTYMVKKRIFLCSTKKGCTSHHTVNR